LYERLRHAPAGRQGPVTMRGFDDRVRTRDARRASSAAVVLRTVLDHGPVARSTIARLTGFSPAAVTRQYAELAALGLVREVAVPEARKGVGRPHVPVDIDSRHVVGGVHIAVPHTTLAVVDLRGRVLAQERHLHDDTDPMHVLNRVAERFPEFLARHGRGRTPLGFGVATGGWVDPVNGVIVEHAPLGWRDVAVREVLGQRLGLAVHVESHSRALANAEQLFGDVRARSSVVHLFVGNVVDAAIATGGTVHHGPGSAAGDIAHLPLDDVRTSCPCGRLGCFQAAVSERTLAARAARDGIIAEPSFPMLLAALRAGEPRTVHLFRQRARLVGRVAALLFDVINPEVLVVTEAGALFAPECLAELRTEVRARSHVCRDPESTVVTTSFSGPEVLGVAAGAVMLDAVYADPLGLRPPVLSPAS
jgi:predicted NBD/HSP70 family sugar kinase